jgi:Uma2 family endonuclease
VTTFTSTKTFNVPNDPIWRLRVDQYHEMIARGILTDDDPVELLEGWLITKMPKNPHHTLATQLTRDMLAEIIPAGWFINVQEPITTSDSEPEPDVTIVRGNRRDYSERHPRPDEVAFIVEVSDATLQRDRTLKLRLYASAGIAIYWILNLQEQQLEIYTNPIRETEQPTYGQRTQYAVEADAPVVIEGHVVGHVPVRRLLS